MGKKSEEKKGKQKEGRGEMGLSLASSGSMITWQLWITFTCIGPTA